MQTVFKFFPLSNSSVNKPVIFCEPTDIPITFQYVPRTLWNLKIHTIKKFVDEIGMEIGSF